MKKIKSTKRALLMSALSLMMCMTMFVGSTFAWFTDSVTSSGNIVKSGTLEVTMEWADGTKSVPTDESTDWNDASKEAIFKSELWEPGYTEVRHIKIANEGSLALKYNVAIQANGTVSKLAEVIDVYYIDPAIDAIIDRTQLNEENKLGTLANVLEKLSETASGNLEAGDKDVITLALKMQESAGNEYQDLAIGTDLSVILFATQYTSEEDHFDNQYDANAPKMYSVNKVQYDTVEAALAAAKGGDEVLLSGVTEPIVINEAIELTIENTNIVAGEGVNAITVNADATIIVNGYNLLVGGKDADGIYVAEDVTLNLTGKGNLVTKGNAGLEYFRYTKDGRIYGENCSNTTDDSFAGKGGSGIEVAGDIVIDGLANLTAEGYGIAGYGIGGNTDSIIIKNTTINYARGGYECSYMFIHDWHDYFYGKKEPEGAPAIGSTYEGANITISDSTIKNAVGGSKGAGIGARYHTGVTIDITNSNITAFGGNSSAGIGGSRITSNATATDSNNDAVTINIKNSTINATGGDYAAGIGSGYNTYADYIKTTPVTKVTIDAASNITAQGGFLGAGIGTGHNVTNFQGDIKCDTANVKAGSSDDKCCDGASTSIAQDIGDGVIKLKSLYTNELASGLYTDDKGDFYVYSAAGLNGLHDWITDTTNTSYNMRKAFWGKTYSIMADIDASDITWKTVITNMDSSNSNGIVFNGNGHTISGLTIEGNGLFTGATHGTDAATKVTVIKGLTLDGVNVTGDTHHNGAVWGNVVGSITLQNVNVINSTVSGDCNVGGLVGRNSESHSTITFKDCSVKNTKVEAKQKRDNAGASAFLGNALHIGTSCSANVVFEGTNVAEGNNLVTAAGMQGGGIYTTAEWETITWDTPVVVNGFTNYNSKNK